MGAQSSLFSLVGEQVVNVGTTGGLSYVRSTADGCEWWEPEIRVAAWKRGPLLRVRDDPQVVLDHSGPVIAPLCCFCTWSS